jgi:hypothetical protein
VLFLNYDDEMQDARLASGRGADGAETKPLFERMIHDPTVLCAFGWLAS